MGRPRDRYDRYDRNDRNDRYDCYLYTLKDRRETVYIGITNDPDARVEEHYDLGKRFAYLEVRSGPHTRSQAKTLEARALEAYRRSHRGWNPRYNFTRDG